MSLYDPSVEKRMILKKAKVIKYIKDFSDIGRLLYKRNKSGELSKDWKHCGVCKEMSDCNKYSIKLKRKLFSSVLIPLNSFCKYTKTCNYLYIFEKRLDFD